MTNKEAHNKYMALAGNALNKIDKMKGFIKEDSAIHKKEHNVAADSIQKALIIMAKCHSLDEKFFKDIKHIIDNHPNSKEFWDWLKMTSLGHE